MGRYRTEQRESLMAFFEKNPDEGFTAGQIYEKIRESGVSLSAVYRNLASLSEEGKIQRIAGKKSREIFYRYTASEKCRDCIHLSCVKCGKTFHLGKKAADEVYSAVEKSEKFSLNKSETVLYGVCSDCDEDTTEE